MTMCVGYNRLSATPIDRSKEPMADPPEIEYVIRDLQSSEDHDAGFRLIYRTYYRWLLGFFRRQGFGESSEDLTQKTFLRVYTGLRDYEHRGFFSAWLFNIAENVSRDERRYWSGTRKRDGLEVPFSDAAGSNEGEEDRFPAVPLPSSASAQVENMYEKERRAILDEAIEDLAPRQRECMTLRLLGHTYDEIGTLARISRETVKQHLKAARKNLQRLLGDFDLTGLDETPSE